MSYKTEESLGQERARAREKRGGHEENHEAKRDFGAGDRSKYGQVSFTGRSFLPQIATAFVKRAARASGDMNS